MKLSAIEELVLELLAARRSRSSYGLELVNRSDGKLKRGTVYVTLQRMEDKGLVESKLDGESAAYVGLRRRIYKATGLGTRSLRAIRAYHRMMRERGVLDG